MAIRKQTIHAGLSPGEDSLVDRALHGQRIMDGRQNMLALLIQGEHAERLLDQNTHLVHDQQKSTKEEPAKVHGMENSTYFFDAEERGRADESSRNDDPVAVVPENYGESEMPENQKS